ncbi:Crp/Fnr family transcriptional regulator [Pedobacter frigiditerrae]|uniref:Crp/Fnr family transcriptional regulator n=1 Tax=Pedobacter frigiditerrae TaxID=2530452 RepID=A0A4R0MRD3_9SPHI|nr:Crp/Fnr family transcriptional regulator [Pedobacter frigiditerrae]TCC89273.1 Crp/Fnr family transcriptional regulator [Pedobacter frigiditerrae]
MNFDDIITRLYLLPESSKETLKVIAKLVSYPKGHLLLKADCIERNIYFIKKGIVRAYADHKDSQVTFWFGVEGAPVLSMKSYISGEKSYEHIELLEDCELYEFNIEQLKEAYQKDVHLANWGRKLAEHELVKTEERLIAMQFKTANERYHQFVTDQPQLLLRVQLGYIASYLGMSQVSLSRIRAEQR